MSNQKEIRFLKLSEIVDGISILTNDDDQKYYLKYMKLAKRVYRELYYNVLGEPTRVLIEVNRSTKTVKLPADYYKLCSLAVLDRCDPPNMFPLAFNSYLNTTKEKEEDCPPVPPGQCCDCQGQSAICDEVGSFQTITETITLPDSSTMIQTTRIKTCPNGDIIKEVCAPTFVAGSPITICDFDINLCSGNSYPVLQKCDYALTFNLFGDNFPFTLKYYNGCNLVTSSVINDATALQVFMQGLGWTGSGFNYTIAGSSIKWGNFLAYMGSTLLSTSTPVASNCVALNSFTIVSYTKNAVTVTVDQVISSQSDLDDFFVTTLGFTKISDTEYNIVGSADTWNNIILTGNVAPIILFTQSNCQTTTPAGTYKLNCITTTECNVPVKACGHIIPSLETEQVLGDIFGNVLQSCCNGDLGNWSNGHWHRKNACMTPIVKPYNKEGLYSVDETEKVLYLDFNLHRHFHWQFDEVYKVLISYKGDGTAADGQCYVPDVPAAVNAMESGIYLYSIKFDKTVSSIEKKRAEIDYETKQTDLHEYRYPWRIEDMIAALNARRKP